TPELWSDYAEILSYEWDSYERLRVKIWFG
ncbi:unnamed protein product, partial [marine sediment metagenome]